MKGLPRTKAMGIALRAKEQLQDIFELVKDKKEDGDIKNIFYKRYTKSAISTLPKLKLNRPKVDKAIADLEDKGYVFSSREQSIGKSYDLNITDVMAITEQVGIKKIKETYPDAYVVFIANLKGGVGKSVTTVTLAQALRTLTRLIHLDIKCLVIDLDPQASSTMFLNGELSVADCDRTAAQAMLSNPSKEDIKDFIYPTTIEGVDIMPASIDDAFLASKWDSLCEEYLPGLDPNEVLKKNVIDKVKDDYSFIFIDSGPHLDPMLKNGLAAADLLATPTPPANVDYQSTLKYLARIPVMLEELAEQGTAVNQNIPNVGFMSKTTSSEDHKTAKTYAKDVFGWDMIENMPYHLPFEKSGDSFDTIISIDPANYAGSKPSLKKAKDAAYDFAGSFYDYVSIIRREAVNEK